MPAFAVAEDGADADPGTTSANAQRACGHEHDDAQELRAALVLDCRDRLTPTTAADAIEQAAYDASLAG